MRRRCAFTPDAMSKHRHLVLDGRVSFGNVAGGLGGMRWVMIACDEPHSCAGWRLAAEAVDPAEREIVGTVERDERESLARRTAAERERAAAGRAGHDPARAGERRPTYRSGLRAAAEAWRKPCPPAERAVSRDGASGGETLEVGGEPAERMRVPKGDLDR